MHTNRDVLERFYTAFASRDAATMARCYAPDASFEDPVFTLQGGEVAAMWHMLCARGKDLEVRFSELHADHGFGSAHWDADYTFGPTGRKVRNSVDATFTFRDGRILTHRDSFALWAWTRQALGAPGVLLGWSPPLQGVLRRRAAADLRAYIQKNPHVTQIG